MQRTRFPLAALAALLVVALLPTAAAAGTSEAVAQTGGNRLTLAIPGAPLGIDVVLDDFGRITQVEITEAPGGGGAVTTSATPEADHPGRVRFVTTDGGTVVDVKAKGAKLSTKVATMDPGAVVGTHEWSADLWGTGSPTSVTFTVAIGGLGYPEIVTGSVATSDPTAVIGPVTTKSDEDEYESETRVTFRNDGYVKTLEIAVETHLGEEDSSRPVTLKTQLKARDTQELDHQPLTDLVGTRTWNGLLCDGSAAAVTYVVTDNGDGTADAVLLDVSIGGAPASLDAYTVRAEEHGFEVRFVGTAARVRIELKPRDDGTWRLKVSSKTTETCDRGDDDHAAEVGEEHHDEDHGEHATIGGDEDHGEHATSGDDEDHGAEHDDED